MAETQHGHRQSGPGAWALSLLNLGVRGFFSSKQHFCCCGLWTSGGRKGTGLCERLREPVLGALCTLSNFSRRLVMFSSPPILQVRKTSWISSLLVSDCRALSVLMLGAASLSFHSSCGGITAVTVVRNPVSQPPALCSVETQPWPLHCS